MYFCIMTTFIYKKVVLLLPTSYDELYPRFKCVRHVEYLQLVNLANVRLGSHFNVLIKMPISKCVETLQARETTARE
jgi:hypothetical protein